MSTQVKGFQRKSDNGDGNFFAIKFGSIVRESKTPQEGFEKIEGKNRRTGDLYTKYIQRFDTIEALITKIEWYDTEQRFTARYQGFKLHLDANGKKGVLDLGIQARTTGRFMKTAESLDFSKPVEFRAWHDSKSDSTAVFIGQGGESVPQKYTRENPGDMPEPSKNYKGDWDYSGQEAFLYKKMIEVVIPRVAAAHPDKQKAEGAETQSETAPSNGSPDAKLLERVKEALGDLSEHEQYQDRSRAQLLDEFFGCSKFSEIESMNPESIKLALKEIDKVVVPF